MRDFNADTEMLSQKLQKIGFNTKTVDDYVLAEIRDNSNNDSAESNILLNQIKEHNNKFLVWIDGHRIYENMNQNLVRIRIILAEREFIRSAEKELRPDEISEIIGNIFDETRFGNFVADALMWSITYNFYYISSLDESILLQSMHHLSKSAEVVKICGKRFLGKTNTNPQCLL